LCNTESHCVVPLNTVPYNPRVINTSTDHSVRTSSSRHSTSSFGIVLPVPTVLPRSESSTVWAYHALTRTDVVSPMIASTSSPIYPSYPGPPPFTMLTPSTNAFPFSHHVLNDPSLPCNPELTQNTSGTHNHSYVGDHVKRLAVIPEVAPTYGASQRADTQGLSDSPVPTFPTPATVPSTSIATSASGVSKGIAVSDSSVISNIEMLGRREIIQASNSGSQTFATHHPRGSRSEFAVIPMEPILPPEDSNSSGNHTYPPLPDTSEAQR